MSFALETIIYNEHSCMQFLVTKKNGMFLTTIVP